MKKNVVCLIFFFFFLFFLCDCFHRWEKKQLGKILMAKHTWKKKEKVLQLKRKKKKKKRILIPQVDFSFFPCTIFFHQKNRFLLFTHFHTWKKKNIRSFFSCVFTKKNKKTKSKHVSCVKTGLLYVFIFEKVWKWENKCFVKRKKTSTLCSTSSVRSCR